MKEIQQKQNFLFYYDFLLVEYYYKKTLNVSCRMDTTVGKKKPKHKE